ncbi:hypothetical protein ENSA5_62010 [Enhygromyxa salina]|uniref:Uncharacterized protein n=1 Tax=Enhygromyxa salina TaxID=215803 RepID=A0A2S9XD47_9BACT|nr:hypothetical protein ENSA5_62010 [Enhygromyxa salina]
MRTGLRVLILTSDVFWFACTIWASLYGSPLFGASTGDDGELERLIELARVRAVGPVEGGPGIPDLTWSLLPALERRVRTLSAKTKPVEIDLLDWASDVAREFIARRIGEQP